VGQNKQNGRWDGDGFGALAYHQRPQEDGDRASPPPPTIHLLFLQSPFHPLLYLFCGLTLYAHKRRCQTAAHSTGGGEDLARHGDCSSPLDAGRDLPLRTAWRARLLNTRYKADAIHLATHRQPHFTPHWGHPYPGCAPPTTTTSCAGRGTNSGVTARSPMGVPATSATAPLPSRCIYAIPAF